MTDNAAQNAATAPVVWIASYPKSGNTWLRFLVYQYFHGKAESSAAISRFIPDVHRRNEVAEARPSADGTVLLKTHFAIGPKLPFQDRTRSALYVIRHPRDTILSWLNYVNLTSTEAVDTKSQRALVQQFLTLGGAATYQERGYGTWEEHFQSWLDNGTFPVHMVRYEDLKAKPEIELRRMVEFLGHAPDEEKIKAAVKLSSFDAMRALEVREKAAGNPDALFVGQPTKTRKGVYFMNKGRTGGSLESIAPGLDKAVDARFAGAMKRFGYA